MEDMIKLTPGAKAEEHMAVKHALNGFIACVKRFLLRYDAVVPVEVSTAKSSVNWNERALDSQFVIDGSKVTLYMRNIDPTLFVPRVEAACRKDRWTYLELSFARANHTNMTPRFEVRLKVTPSFPQLPIFNNIHLDTGGRWMQPLKGLSDTARNLVWFRCATSITTMLYPNRSVSTPVPKGLRPEMCMNIGVTYPGRYWVTKQDIDACVDSMVEALCLVANRRKLDAIVGYSYRIEDSVVKAIFKANEKRSTFDVQAVIAAYPAVAYMDAYKHGVAKCVKREMEGERRVKADER